MQQKKSLTQNGLTTSHTVLIFLSMAIIGVCLYLTKHYFDLHFSSEDLSQGKSLCNLNSFFTCDRPHENH